MHASQRRKFEYADVCSQCGKACAPTDRVAAHVVRYPCVWCGLCGTLELTTTCKQCNNSSHPNGRTFAPISAHDHERIGYAWCAPICLPYKMVR